MNKLVVSFFEIDFKFHFKFNKFCTDGKTRTYIGLTLKNKTPD